MSFQGKTALVTGAATGIGRATALAFARAGADLYLCDVNEAGLAKAASEARALGRAVVESRVDVGSRDEMRAFADRVHRDQPAVDILVNNAGVGLAADFVETTLEDWDWIVSVNFWGVVHGCHFFVPPMIARGRGGHVVNVASTAGFFATPVLSAYSATKFAVLGLSESLRDELRPHGISVATICPGVIDTPIVKTARSRGRWAAPEVREKSIHLFEKRRYGPEKVATAILDAVRRGRAVVPVAPEAWAFYLLKRLAPDLGHRVVARMVGPLFGEGVGRRP